MEIKLVIGTLSCRDLLLEENPLLVLRKNVAPTLVMLTTPRSLGIGPLHGGTRIAIKELLCAAKTGRLFLASFLQSALAAH